MKRPASQYYWGDWRRDTALQACSLAARGLWHEMNCLMHDCEPYGHLCVGPAAMQPAQLARLVGITPKECTLLLDELEGAGVFSRTPEGVIYSRRMVRDEALRERRANGGQAGAEHGAKGAKHGAKGGRPSGKNPPSGDGGGGLKTPLGSPEYPPPASASASAIETTERGERAPPPEVEGQQPTDAGLACRAMRRAGVVDGNPGHARLAALLQAGVQPQAFGDAAAECVAKGKGRFDYVLGLVEGRLRDAATARAMPAGGGVPWHETRSGIEDKGAALGLGRWDQDAFEHGRGEPWPAYQRRVFQAAGHDEVMA